MDGRSGGSDKNGPEVRRGAVSLVCEPCDVRSPHRDGRTTPCLRCARTWRCPTSANVKMSATRVHCSRTGRCSKRLLESGSVRNQRAIRFRSLREDVLRHPRPAGSYRKGPGMPSEHAAFATFCAVRQRRAGCGERLLVHRRMHRQDGASVSTVCSLPSGPLMLYRTFGFHQYKMCDGHSATLGAR